MTYRCPDRMCGADDCATCHPENCDPDGNYKYCYECGAVLDEGICPECEEEA